MELMASRVQGKTEQKDWREVPFGSLYTTPSRNGVYKTEEFHGRGFRIVNMGEMFGYDFISDQEMNLVSLTASELAVSALRDGDLLFGRRSVVEAGAGKCSLVVCPTNPLTFESSIIRVRLNAEAVVPRFYYYFFKSPVGRECIRSIVSGTNVKGVRGSELYDVVVPLPDRSEQHVIAAALSDVDALLGALDQLIAKKRDIKQAAMQQLLTGQTRLPGFSGKWETKRLGSVGTFEKGKGLSKEDMSDSGFPAIPYTAIYTDHAEIIDVSRIRHFTQSTEALAVISTPHLLIASSSNMLENIGKATAFVAEKPVAVGGDVLLYRTTADVRFVSYVLSTRLHRHRIISLSQGSTIRHVYASTFRDFELTLPPLSEQTAIANVLSDMDAELTALEKRREKTRLLKQGMMQELLTGKTRLV